MSNLADYLPPGPPDPPRLCKYCDTRRSNHTTPIHKPDCPRHPANRAPQPDAGPLDHHQMAHLIGAGCEDDVPHGDLCDAFLSLYKGQPEAEPVDPRTVDDSVQALIEGHDLDTLEEIARRLLGRDEPEEGESLERLISIYEGEYLDDLEWCKDFRHRTGAWIHALNWLHKRLRARVQPRRVGKSEWDALINALASKGYQTGRDFDVAHRTRELLGIEITPTEEG